MEKSAMIEMIQETKTNRKTVSTKKQIYIIRTQDSVELMLTRYKGSGKNGIVFLTHGLSLATNMFTLKEHKNIVQHLLEEGFSEVWLLDSRGSCRLPYNNNSESYNLDDIGYFDIPAAFEKIKEVTGQPPSEIHAIAFCVGSTALFISLLSGALPNLKSVIAVQAGPVLKTPLWSRLKLNVAVPALRQLGINSISPTSGDSNFIPRKLFAKIVKYAHRAEDTTPAMISFLSGSGYPAVYQPKNLAEKTRDHITDLFGVMPFSYHEQIRNIVENGFLVSSNKKKFGKQFGFVNYLDAVKKLKTPILFVTSEHARVFPDSNLTAYQIFESERPGLQKFLKIADYGHLDTFIGAHADQDVFPHFTQFLNTGIHNAKRKKSSN